MLEHDLSNYALESSVNSLQSQVSACALQSDLGAAQTSLATLQSELPNYALKSSINSLCINAQVHAMHITAGSLALVRDRVRAASVRNRLPSARSTPVRCLIMDVD